MWYRNLECLLNLWFTTFQVCFFSSMLRRRNERGKCKQQTIEVIQLCLSCVLLFLIDFQTHVFGYHIQTRCSLPRYQGASMWPKCGHAIGLSLDELLMSLRRSCLTGKVTKASGPHHGISARLLKNAAPVIAKPITYLVNLTISTGLIPAEWKGCKSNTYF